MFSYPLWSGFCSKNPLLPRCVLSWRRFPWVRLLLESRRNFLPCTLHFFHRAKIVFSYTKGLYWFYSFIQSVGGNPHEVAFAVPGGDCCTAAGVLPCWGLPQLLDPQASPRGVGVPEDPPRPPWVHRANRIRSSICTLGWGAHTRHPLLRRAGHCSRPHDHILALDYTPSGGGYRDT